jgi:predicted  nucleic acid-binding Zn-ribbon protein
VTTAIKSSLTKLNGALQQLETSVSAAESKLQNAAANTQPAAPKGQTHDLFGAVSNDTEAKALASRLDGAIAKVERLLREGEVHG